MKRWLGMIIIVLLLISVISSALADEILFRGVSWGVNPAVARKQIDDPETYMQATYTNGSIAYPLKTAERLLDRSKNYWDGNYEFFSQHMILTRVCSLYMRNEPKVGGYNIHLINMYFANDIQEEKIIYDEKASHFAMAEYTFDILDGNKAYADLKTKLSSLYGQGEEVNDSYKDAMWFDNGLHGYIQNNSIVSFTGDNGTHAQLLFNETISDEEPDKPTCELMLIYWCDQYVDMIREMDEILRIQDEKRLQEEYNARLQEEQTIDQDDIGGL